MKASPINISAPGVAKSLDMRIEVHVTGMKILRARIWLGSLIMRLGAWVIGVGRCEIVEK